MRPKIYISGPVSKGNMFANFTEFGEYFHKLVGLGFAPRNPGESMLMPGNQQIPWRTWVDIDIPWVAVSDVVMRIPGDSVGADEECEVAAHHGIPVIHRYHDLKAWKQTWEAGHRSVANGT